MFGAFSPRPEEDDVARPLGKEMLQPPEVVPGSNPDEDPVERFSPEGAFSGGHLGRNEQPEWANHVEQPLGERAGCDHV